MSCSGNNDDLKFLLTSKKSWLLEENWSPLYSSLVKTYSSEVFGKQTIKVEECSKVSDTESCSQSSSLNKNAGSQFGLLKVKDGRVMYECDYCHKCFLDRSAIEHHRRYHTGEKPYNCDVCRKSFASKYEYNVHTRRHIGEKPFICDVCEKSFVTKGALDVHRLSHATKKKSFPCLVCDKLFTYKTSLKRHMYTHNIETPFKERLDEPSDAIDELHSGTYSQEKPFKCDICQKSYALKKVLETHIVSHTGEKPFKCETCRKSFVFEHSLKRHMSTHTTKKSFKCGVCEKSFSSNQLLMDHNNIHAGVKPYTCDVCNKSFAHKYSYSRHSKLHAGIPSEGTFSTCGDNIKDENTQGITNSSISKVSDINTKEVHNNEALKDHMKLHKQKDSAINVNSSNERDDAKDKITQNSDGHKEKKSFSCDKCGKVFQRMQRLLKHKRFECYYTALEVLRAQKLKVKNSASS